MRFAYADPPYLGCCSKYNHYHGSNGNCWDDIDTHRELITYLVETFPDGWALSLGSNNLRDILPLCPPDIRIGSWCKTFGAFRKGVRPAYMWEPVIFRGGRNPTNGHKHAPPKKGGKQNTPKDFLEYNQPDALLCRITMMKGLTGAKPEAFCEWVLSLLNMHPGDTLVDIFPGTGVMSGVARSVALAWPAPEPETIYS